MSRIADARVRAGHVPPAEEEALRWEAERDAAADLLAGARPGYRRRVPLPAAVVTPPGVTLDRTPDATDRPAVPPQESGPTIAGIFTVVRSLGARVFGIRRGTLRPEDARGLNLRG